MKNIILLVAAMCISVAGFSQIKVVAPNGDTKIGNTAVAPSGKLHVDGGDAIFTGGDVGIGILNPDRTFHMRGTNATLRIDRDRNSPGFILAKYSTGFGSVENSFSFTTPVIGANKYFQISDLNGAVTGGGTRRLVIDDDGGLIVGTSVSTPFQLRVEGDAIKTDGLVDWDIPSDKKLKKNIKSFKQGLDVVMDLKPVSYEYNGKAGTTNGQKAIGVLAQDLREVAPHMVKETIFTDTGDDGIEYLDGAPEGLKIESKEETYLSINTSSLQWILVNAIQEQQITLQNKEEKILELENKLNALESRIDKLITNSQVINTQDVTFNSKSELAQNIPNPFNENTTINYSVPENATSAEMKIYDLNGRLLKSVKLTNGNGKLNLNTAELGSNTYVYSLLIDGKILDSKKMTKIK